MVNTGRGEKVQEQFPGLNISVDQLHSLENLRGMPSLAAHQTLTNRWNAFYLAHPNPTLQQVMDQVKALDDEFGHSFIPPIR